MGRALGYIPGPGGPKDDVIPAMLSNREYVLDAETTRNIGVDTLDKVRGTKGRNLNAVMRMMRHARMPQEYAGGGIVVGASSTPAPAPTAQTTGLEPTVKVYVTNSVYDTGDGISFKTDVYLDTPEGRQKVVDVLEQNIIRQGATGPIPEALRAVKR